MTQSNNSVICKHITAAHHLSVPKKNVSVIIRYCVVGDSLFESLAFVMVIRKKKLNHEKYIFFYLLSDSGVDVALLSPRDS